MKKRIKVLATYSWEFDKKEWEEVKEHWDGIKEDVRIGFEWDNITMFHSLNDLCFPDVHELRIEDV